MVVERRRSDTHEGPFLAQDRAVERLQLGAGLDPELLDERPARVVIRRERLRLAAAPVEREHQLAPEPLAQGLGTDEHLDLRDELGVRSQLEIGRDPLLEHAQAQVLEPVDLRLREGLELEVGERGSPPQAERLAEQQRPLLRLGGASFPRESLEARQIELVGLELEDVAGGPGEQAGGPEQLAQLRDGVLQRGGGRAWWVLPPELVDEPLRRHHFVHTQEEERQERALISAAEQNGFVPVENLERTEDPELEHGLVVTGFTIL